MSKIFFALKGIPLFSDMTDEKLEKIAKNFTLVKEKKDVVLYLEGENPDCINFLVFGTVKAVTHLNDNGKELVNSIYQAGNFFAESSLDKLPLPFTLISRDNVVMLRINTGDFRQILEADLNLFWSFLQLQALEKLDLNRKLTIIGQPDAEKRIKEYLVYTHQRSKNGIPFISTHKEIGEAISITRETVTRVIGIFEKAGKIKINGRQIIPCFG